MKYDAWVIVGTKLDTKQLEKDLKDSEKKLSQYEKEAEKLIELKAKAEIDLEPYEEQKRLIQEMTNEMNEYAQTEEEVANNLAVEEKQLEELDKQYSKQKQKLDDINFKIEENAKNQELVKNQISETNEKLKVSKGYDNIKNILKEINKETVKTMKTIARWTLAIFSIRTAYGLVRNAISTLSRYNEQLAYDMEYMQFAIAKALEDTIKKIVELAYKFLIYIDYIANKWFGVSLFSEATADAMNKGAKSAEKMKKSLAGFDEMNVLSDNGTTGATGVTSPSFDLSAPEDVPVPSWIQFIVDNKEYILTTLAGIAGFLIAINLGLGGIMGLGIGLVLAGIVLLVQGIIDFLKEPTWENFLGILQGIALVVAGIAVLFGGWIVALVAFGVAIVANVIQNWDKVKSILGVVGSWINEKIIQPVARIFSGLWDGIKNGVGTAVSWVKEKFNAMITFFSNLIDKIVGFFKNLGGKVGDVIGGAFKAVINGILWSIETILNSPIKAVNKLIKVINKVPGIDLGTLPTFSLPRLAVGGIVNMPSRGVQVGGAIAGEAGAEGVIPLTDSQAMETLGATIGKYINLNATIPIYVGNRQIAREMKRINLESDFAYNR